LQARAMSTQLVCRKTAGQRAHLPGSTHCVHRRFTSCNNLSTDISDSFQILRRFRRACPCRRFAPSRAAAATPAATGSPTGASDNARGAPGDTHNSVETAAAAAAAAAEARQTSQPLEAPAPARSPTRSRLGVAVPLDLTSTRVLGIHRSAGDLDDDDGDDVDVDREGGDTAAIALPSLWANSNLACAAFSWDMKEPTRLLLYAAIHVVLRTRASQKIPRYGPCLAVNFVELDLKSHTDAPASQPPAAAASAGAAAAAEPQAEEAAGARAADCGAAGGGGFGDAPRNHSMCSYRACAARRSEGKVPMYLPPAMANHTTSRPSRAARL